MTLREDLIKDSVECCKLVVSDKPQAIPASEIVDPLELLAVLSARVSLNVIGFAIDLSLSAL
ncbi:hypothetical protein BDW66DRAFT_124175 [Aspergillus desertorum]